MNYLAWIKRSTPTECRDLAVKILNRDDWRESVEMVGLLLELGAKDRTPEWYASVDVAIEAEKLVN